MDVRTRDIYEEILNEPLILLVNIFHEVVFQLMPNISENK